jgi:bifunctional non-homologous end joining protein LigD
MGKIKIGTYVIEITNEDKILFPESKITKGDLINYYKNIGKFMLPYLKDRPISMLRYPLGISKEGFYQKEAGEYFPKWIKTKKIKKEDGFVNQVIINNIATLVYLANQACISPHIWLSRTDKINYPDKIVFDLDPSGKNFDHVREGAILLKDKLDSMGLISYAMLTGSRGIHVIVPIKRKYDFDYVRNFAQDIARDLVNKNKNLFTLEMRKEKRGKKVFIDTLRNAYAQTSIAPYAVRPIEGAPVATPILWQEVLDNKLTPDKYNIKNIFNYLEKNKNKKIWGNFLKKRGEICV